MAHFVKISNMQSLPLVLISSWPNWWLEFTDLILRCLFLINIKYNETFSLTLSLLFSFFFLLFTNSSPSVYVFLFLSFFLSFFLSSCIIISHIFLTDLFQPFPFPDGQFSYFSTFFIHACVLYRFLIIVTVLHLNELFQWINFTWKLVRLICP